MSSYVVLGVAQRCVTHFVVVGEAVSLVEQLSVFLHVTVGVDTGHTDTDVIFRTCIKRAFVHKHQRLVVVDEVGVFVVEGGVGRDIQAARSVTVVAGELLLRNEPVTVFAAAHTIGSPEWSLRRYH